MDRVKLFFCVCFFLLLAVFLPAETADRIEAMLKMEAVSYGEAAWLVLAAADIPVSSPEAAFRYAADQRWLPKNAESTGRARLDGIAHLIMQSFNVKGGLLYSFTKAPHYAYRELVYRGMIQGRTDPQMTVSGDLMLYTINRVLSFQEANIL